MKLVHTAKLRQPVRVGLARAAYQTGGPCLDRLDSAKMLHQMRVPHRTTSSSVGRTKALKAVRTPTGFLGPNVLRIRPRILLAFPQIELMW